MIPPDGVKRKLGGVVDSDPRDKCCDMLYGELTHKQWGEIDSEKCADSDDDHILQILGAL